MRCIGISDLTVILRNKRRSRWPIASAGSTSRNSHVQKDRGAVNGTRRAVHQDNSESVSFHARARLYGSQTYRDNSVGGNRGQRLRLHQSHPVEHLKYGPAVSRGGDPPGMLFWLLGSRADAAVAEILQGAFEPEIESIDLTYLIDCCQ